jgi:2-(3-amino-3-carboxypropyl)histidine synthase
MPDGFMIFSVLIADILSTFADCECVILGDITYGACCIDDLGSQALGCDFIIHYGHSCLVPITQTVVKAMYVFVDIQIDLNHLVETIELNFQKNEPIYLMGSVQYNNSVFLAKRELTNKGFVNVTIPQAKPRSAGEVLGCTSPSLEKLIKADVGNSLPPIIFVCDGRFHMESAMIANPSFTFYQYNPFLKSMTLEQYDVKLMKSMRYNIIQQCKGSKTVGIIFGILGRQGNPDILSNITGLLDRRSVKYTIILLSEIMDAKLVQYEECECFVQIACPRISIDWGSYFTKPVITPYEAFVVWSGTEWRENYPMDFYSYDGGEWTNFYNRKNK